jgi:hypothetical protein
MFVSRHKVEGGREGGEEKESLHELSLQRSVELLQSSHEQIRTV